MSNLGSLLTIFLVILLGIFSYKKEVFHKSHIDGLELFLFKVALPMYLFVATYKADLVNLLELNYISAYLLTWLILAIITGIFYIKKMQLKAVLIRMLAASYVNAAIYTLPIVSILLGNPISAIIGNILQVVVIQPIFIILLNLVQSHDRSLTRRILNIVTTPLIISPILGLILNNLQLNLPLSLIDAASKIGDCASGIALFTFGLTLGSTKITRDCLKFDLLSVVFAKNILHPTVAFCVINFMKLEGYWANSLIIASAAPTAFIVYIISKQFTINEELVKKSVALSSVLSTISLIFIIGLIHS